MLQASTIIRNSGISFGTSGARGLVTDFTNPVCAAFTHAFVHSLRQEFQFEQVALAIDNRPSSYAMAQSCAGALMQLRIHTFYYGVIPTPALAYTAMRKGIPCIMVTGSHIPFDRNGLKFYRPDGEITKQDELRIIQADCGFEASITLPELTVDSTAADNYLSRFIDLFTPTFLIGKRIGIYEHSSAGRELYHRLFQALGAETVSLGRSDQFIPIDTEAVSQEDRVKAKRWIKEHQLDVIFSTDGDGDRPLVTDENGEWLRGDILGLLCSQALGIEALSVPVNCNSVIANSPDIKHVTLTKIGSPYVIAEFDSLTANYSSAAGFEANGGFMLATDMLVNGASLKALPTRDAVLPVLMLLYAAQNSSVAKLVEQLPMRFTYSDRIQNYATAKSLELVAQGEAQPEALLKTLGITANSVDGKNTLDGLRLLLSDGSIIHLRPSGNAPELRCYAEASSSDKAKQLVDTAIVSLTSSP
ncbi:phosphomannomutase [Vibrio hangzhouensis]|uniref:Phosphomannomutase n=1 Tax=Vibrio hangzhouensis TaxID=462991 RepID=A0A1H5ZD59_9VIBR|nr:phosphomannomutase [Vibrio hangzhouensis]SEG33665.1 phosphomannomutase [Vibrio hangzhouensis]